MSHKVGAMTCCWNEEATIAFTVGSLLPHVDHYVVADTGSTDKTVELLETIFAKELESGKLILLKCEKRDDWDISIPKNAIIERLRELECDYFIRLDGDDVFYDKGAREAVKAAREMPEGVTAYTLNHWELYQNEAATTRDWLELVSLQVDGTFELSSRFQNGFWCMRMPPGANPTMSGYPHRFDGSYGHARIYRCRDAVSMGKWTDEAWHRGPGEDIGHPGARRDCRGNHDETIVHYGWARPMEKKLTKGAIWSGENKADEDPRVGRMEKVWENVDAKNVDRFDYGMKYWPRSIIFPFNKHPEVFERLIKQVAEIIKA